MPDGGAPLYERWRCAPADQGWRKPLPPNSAAAAKAYREPVTVPDKPIEKAWRGLTVCQDAAPARNPEHRPQAGPGVEHTLSQYTLRACGIHKVTQYPQLSGDETEWLTVRDPAARDRSKEQKRRPRMRSRIVRAGVATLLDPGDFPADQAWAVERVNRVAVMRFTLPLCEADGRRCAWVDDPDPLLRHIDLWIFRTIAKRSGRNKLGPKTIVRRLTAALRDAPTLIGKGRVSDLHSDRLELAERLSCLTRALEFFEG